MAAVPPNDVEVGTEFEGHNFVMKTKPVLTFPPSLRRADLPRNCSFLRYAVPVPFAGGHQGHYLKY